VICAALTHVDFCETHKEEAYRVNTEAVRNINEQCIKRGCKTVLLSTEYVFDGTAGPYREDDALNPLSVYGKTKLAAEGAVETNPHGFLNIRTTVAYSYIPGSKNFLMQLLRRLSAGEKMTVPHDQYSNPTYVPEMAQNVLSLLELGKNGVFHVVGGDVMNRYDFAVQAAQAFGLDASLVEPKATSQLGQLAPRPLKAGLRTDKLTRETGITPLGALGGIQAAKKLWLENGKQL
jgi:dTDP-4-dehydrorhamnose reductase